MEKKRRLTSLALKLVALLFLLFVATLFGGTTNLVQEVAVLSVKSYLPEWSVTTQNEEAAVEPSELAKEHTSEETTVQKLQASADMNDSLSKTDSDIEKLIKKAASEGVNDKKDGDIYEYTFTDDGATDSFENVRVKNTNKTQISIAEKLSEKLELEMNENEPQILIYHTHTTETYQILDRDFYAQGFLSRSNDENLNMIRVGKAIKEQLEKSGYRVIHDTTVYDKKYSGAYYRSMDAAEAYLEKFPSIKITLDIHRDAIQNDSGVKTKPTAVIDGKKAAQIMIIAGCQEEGNGITDLPEWEKNLTFALKLQRSMETLYPGLTRPVFFCARSYNMGLTPWSLLVEVGTDANTIDEAVYSGKMLGRALGELIAAESEVKV